MCSQTQQNRLEWSGGALSFYEPLHRSQTKHLIPGRPALWAGGEAWSSCLCRLPGITLADMFFFLQEWLSAKFKSYSCTFTVQGSKFQPEGQDVFFKNMTTVLRFCWWHRSVRVSKEDHQQSRWNSISFKWKRAGAHWGNLLESAPCFNKVPECLWVLITTPYVNLS